MGGVGGYGEVIEFMSFVSTELVASGRYQLYAPSLGRIDAKRDCFISFRVCLATVEFILFVGRPCFFCSDFNLIESFTFNEKKNHHWCVCIFFFKWILSMSLMFN